MPVRPPPRPRRLAALAVAVAAATPAAVAVAAPTPPSIAADRAIGASLAALGDPFALAREADRHGEVAVPRLLRDARAPVLARLGAIRAAPHVDLPVPALVGLATVAGGRDPDLAPAAAAALRAMSVDPARSPGAVTGPPRDRASLAGFSGVLAGVAARETVRPDLRRAVALARLTWEGSGWL